jgi:hypothetical protein
MAVSQHDAEYTVECMCIQSSLGCLLTTYCCLVDHILLSPTTAIKKLSLQSCGVSVRNRPLMAGIHKNTSLFQLWGGDATSRLFIDSILQPNVYLGHVHSILRSTASTFPATRAVVGENVAVVQPTTIPPPCNLWATVMAKVGQGTTQGSCPVFTILQDQLATLIPP